MDSKEKFISDLKTIIEEISDDSESAITKEIENLIFEAFTCEKFTTEQVWQCQVTIDILETSIRRMDDKDESAKTSKEKRGGGIQTKVQFIYLIFYTQL